MVDTTRITVNGMPTTIERLQPGMPVRAAYHVVSFEAIVIAARVIDGDRCTLFRTGATVKAVNLRDSVLTIAPELGGRASSVERAGIKRGRVKIRVRSGVETLSAFRRGGDRVCSRQRLRRVHAPARRLRELRSARRNGRRRHHDSRVDDFRDE